MLHQLFLIFLAGIIIDLLAARYTRAIADKKLWPATILSGLITMANFVLLTLILKESATEGMLHIMAYASGNAVGTYLALKKV